VISFPRNYGSFKNSHQTLFATFCGSAVSNVGTMQSDKPLFLPGFRFRTGIEIKGGLLREDDLIRHGPFYAGPLVQLF
jgi:hypothetical protein